MTDVGGTTNTKETQSRNMINICTKYGFDILITSWSYWGHRQHTIDNGQRQGYGYQLPTGELKINVTGIEKGQWRFYGWDILSYCFL